MLHVRGPEIRIFHYGQSLSLPGPYPEMWSGGSSAEGTRSHSNGDAESVDGDGVWGGGCAPSPEKFWHFLLRNGAF